MRAVEGVSREVVKEEVGRCAREIIPSFNAYIHFRIGYWLGRRVAELSYRVRLGFSDESSPAEIEPDSGVAQAVYLEGGFSRDGLLRPPKPGLHGIMVKDFDPTAKRDLVFIPVGINYDRVFEEVGSAVPVLPVSPVATVFLQADDAEISELDLKARVHALMGRPEQVGAGIYIPRFDQHRAVAVGLRMLTLRHLVDERNGLYRLRSDERPVLLYYANAITHYLNRPAGITHEHRSLKG